MRNDGAICLNVEAAARIIAIWHEPRKEKMETGLHEIITGEITHDDATPSPDDDSEQTEADNGTA